MRMSELKLCKDCKHYQQTWAHPFGGPFMPESCRAPELTRTSPVTGNQIWIDAKADHAPLQMREAGGCGADARWFEQAPPPAPPLRNPGPSNLGPMPAEESPGFWDSIAAIFR